MSRIMTGWIMIVVAASLAACSATKDDAGEGGSTANSTATSVPATSVPAALSGESGFALATECSAKLKSVSRLYSTLAGQSSGTEAQDLTTRASQRESAATAFARIAEQVAGTIGKTPAQAAQALTDADAAVQAEFDKRELEDFVTWVTNDVDTKCREAISGSS